MLTKKKKFSTYLCKDTIGLNSERLVKIICNGIRVKTEIKTGSISIWGDYTKSLHLERRGSDIRQEVRVINYLSKEKWKYELSL